MAKINDKERILKAVRGKQTLTGKWYKWNPIGLFFNRNFVGQKGTVWYIQCAERGKKKRERERERDKTKQNYNQVYSSQQGYHSELEK